jgi:plastocyanin domain-containing protein
MKTLIPKQPFFRALTITVLISGALLLVAGTFIFFGAKRSPFAAEAGITENVTMENGTQIIHIRASRGYSPKTTRAKSGIPTIIRMDGTGTYDCSSAVVIPQVNYRGTLDTAKTTDIPIDAQTGKTTLRGLCSMGMYSFSIQFE